MRLNKWDCEGFLIYHNDWVLGFSKRANRLKREVNVSVWNNHWTWEFQDSSDYRCYLGQRTWSFSQDLRSNSWSPIRFPIEECSSLTDVLAKLRDTICSIGSKICGKNSNLEQPVRSIIQRDFTLETLIGRLSSRLQCFRLIFLRPKRHSIDEGNACIAVPRKSKFVIFLGSSENFPRDMQPFRLKVPRGNFRFSLQVLLGRFSRVWQKVTSKKRSFSRDQTDEGNCFIAVPHKVKDSRLPGISGRYVIFVQPFRRRLLSFWRPLK